MHRNRKILVAIQRSMKLLEIGPLAEPIAPKADGWQTVVVDHASREELVAKYANDPNVDTSRIEEVDVVWSGGPLDEAVPAETHGTFDGCIASHVFEHLPDPIGFLHSLERILGPDGVVSLVVPDKRYCFDFFKPLSSVGGLLEAHEQRPSRHSRKARFDHEAYSVRADGEHAWSRRPVKDIDFFVSLAHAKHGFDTHGTAAADPYVDVHAWHFTPSSFELVMLELGALETIDFSITCSFPTEGCEFYATLRRGRDGPESEEELRARRLELLRQTLSEIREQAELMDGDAPSDELGQRLAMQLSSRSRRLRGPLRRLRSRLPRRR